VKKFRVVAAPFLDLTSLEKRMRYKAFEQPARANALLEMGVTDSDVNPADS
jgi:hypothetical protein